MSSRVIFALVRSSRRLSVCEKIFKLFTFLAQIFNILSILSLSSLLGKPSKKKLHLSTHVLPLEKCKSTSKNFQNLQNGFFSLSLSSLSALFWLSVSSLLALSYLSLSIHCRTDGAYNVCLVYYCDIL